MDHASQAGTLDSEAAVAALTRPLSFLEKLRVAAAAGIAVLLMTSIGWMVARPVDPEMAVTFVYGGRHVLAVWPSVLVLTLVSALVGTAIAGRRLPEAGLFAAAVGLVGLALRGSSMQSVLGYQATADLAGRRAVMAAMAFDCLLWASIAVATWVAVHLAWHWLWQEARTPEDDEPRPKAAAPAGKKISLRSGWPALVVTTVVGLFVIWTTIARTPVATIARGQVIASVAAGMYLGAMAGRYFTGVSKAYWYALAPLAAGLTAYLLGYLQADLGWAKGSLASYALLSTTPPHALVRPLPVEYIFVGLAGAMFGFWSGERMEHVAEREMS